MGVSHEPAVRMSARLTVIEGLKGAPGSACKMASVTGELTPVNSRGPQVLITGLATECPTKYPRGASWSYSVLCGPASEVIPHPFHNVLLLPGSPIPRRIHKGKNIRKPGHLGGCLHMR